MWIAWILAIILLALGLGPILGMTKKKWLVLASPFCIVGGLWLLIRSVLPGYALLDAPKVANPPNQIAADGFVTSETCQSCHPRKYKTWHASYHRTMTQVADPESIIGRFDGQPLEASVRVGGSKGLFTFYPVRRGDQFLFEMNVPRANWFSGRSKIETPVVLTTGSHHMQLYWWQTKEDRSLSLFPFGHLVSEDRWVPRQSLFLKPHRTHVGLENGRWNEICMQCHTTHAKARIDIAGRTDSTVSEFGISCEACHGPALNHVRAYDHPLEQDSDELGRQPDSTIVNPAQLEPRRRSEACGQCHSVWLLAEPWSTANLHGVSYRPGGVLRKSKFILSRDQFEAPHIQQLIRQKPDLLDGLFWSDGMVRVAGREYNGLIESPCYQHAKPDRILSCLSCHQMHAETDDPRPLHQWANDQLGIGMGTNHACVQCHDEYADPARVAEHTHHPTGSSGSLCYNCHMPYTSYGLLKAVRSHQISSPKVQESLHTGRPNSCNQCHLDRTLAWTAEHLESWYGVPQPTLDLDDRTIAASVRWALAGDAGQRALMAWSMGWEDSQQASRSDWMVPYLAQLLDDPYGAVQYIAYRSLRTMTAYSNVDFDFLDSQSERQRAASEILKLWSTVKRPANGPVLISAEGRLQRAAFDALLQKRDDRYIYLRE